jgi:hypothetical protein
MAAKQPGFHELSFLWDCQMPDNADLFEPHIVLLARLGPDDRDALDRLVDAEEDLSHLLGTTVAGNCRRRRLVFVEGPVDREAVARQLALVEALRAEYSQRIAQGRLADPKLPDTLGTRATRPPRIVTATGYLDLTARNLDSAIQALLTAPALRVRYFVKTAFRARTLDYGAVHAMLQQQIATINQRRQRALDHYMHDRVAAADARRTMIERQIGFLIAFRGVMRFYGIDDWHVRVESGLRYGYSARFEGQRQSMPFTLTDGPTFIRTVPRVELEQTFKRVQPAEFQRVGDIDGLHFFLPERHFLPEVLDALAVMLDNFRRPEPAIL